MPPTLHERFQAAKDSNKVRRKPLDATTFWAYPRDVVRRDAHLEDLAMQMSGYIALFASLVLSRIINERAVQKLTPDEKVRLMDGFSRSRAYSLVPILIAMIAFWYLMTHTEIHRGLLAIGYFCGLFIFVLVHAILNQRKLERLSMPAEYRKLFTLSQIISVGGMAWFFYIMFTTI